MPLAAQRFTARWPSTARSRINAIGSAGGVPVFEPRHLDVEPNCRARCTGTDVEDVDLDSVVRADSGPIDGRLLRRHPQQRRGWCHDRVVRIREDPESSLARLREICLHLPGVTERLSHGEPTWFVRRSFVMYADHHHDDRLACWCAAPVGNQEELVAADPDRFFVPPYVGGRGWVGVRLDVPVDWVEIAEIVLDAYRTVAPKKLLAELDG